MSGYGKIARASFVMAFVKRDELSHFILERRPIKAIARYYERNPDTVARAIGFLKNFEKPIGEGNVAVVAQEVWHGILGWERTAGFLEAKNFIDRGVLMPKELCGNRRKARKTTAGSDSIRRPQRPGVGGAQSAGATTAATASGDPLLDELSNAAILQRAARVATVQTQPQE